MNMLKQIFLVMVINFLISAVFAGVSLKKNNMTSNDLKGVPFIVFSSTFYYEKENEKYISNEILSVLQDGTVSLMVMKDNKNNLKLKPENRKLFIKNFGPDVLSEEFKSELQQFFSDSLNWTLSEKSYITFPDVVRKGTWLAELTLKYGSDEHKCYLSSVDKSYDSISKPGYDFITLLKQISRWLMQQKQENQELS